MMLANNVPSWRTQLNAMRGQLDEMKTDSIIRKNELAAKMRLEIDQSSDIGKWAITSHWINTGKTDATDFKGWDDFKIFKHLEETDSISFLDPITPGVALWGGIDISSCDGSHFPTKHIDTQDAWEILYGRSSAILWGYVEYRDIFDVFYTIGYCNSFNFEIVGREIRMGLPHFFRTDCNKHTRQTE